jgi:hypothetical protein
MKPRFLCPLTIIALLLLAGCSTTPPSPTATPVPPTRIPPTPTPAPPTPTPVPLTGVLESLSAAPVPTTITVCGDGCDFTTIQAALDDEGTTDDAAIEITDAAHTEAGIVVDKSVTIRGLGADVTIVQAHETVDEAPERVFLIEEDATVILEGMTIRHGRPSVEDDLGGGIMNWGTLTLRECVVTDNVANGGGGICTSGSLTLIGSTVRNNTAAEARPPAMWCGGGGGIKCGNGPLVVVNSTISHNQAGIEDRGWGGAVHVGCNCRAVFVNSTLSGNKSVVDGGAVRVRGSLRLVNCTITNNASDKGGGLHVVGRLDYENTIIAGNPRGRDCVLDSSYGFNYQGEGSIGLNSNNLVGSGNCEPDYGDDPLLGPLADNGGPTLTHALLPGSPAIDAIPTDSCTFPTDQRGVGRPGVQTSADTPCDIGAFEVGVE